MTTRSVFGIVLTAITAASCGGSANGGGGAASGRGAMPAMAVEIVTLNPKPVEQFSEYVATVKSRQSTNIQPQVEGYLTRILVKSGARVARGALLMEIDSQSQQASIAALNAVRTQREIDVTYAKQESDRQVRLLAAGAASQMDADRAANALKAAEAQLRTADEQIQQARTDLAYYRVTAPTSGIVGDIPVHEGDRVTKSTLLTTIDTNAGLEVYVNVPVQQAPQLKLGLPVRIVDENGDRIAEQAVNFIAPSVDTATQTVLTKVPLPAAGNFRTDQYVRAQIVWSTAPGLTIPVTSVVRINGQFFAYVAEQNQAGLVARQRAVTLGPVVGNEYVVLNGVRPGERLIVSGIQKIGDGAPVREGGPAPARGAA